MSDNLANVHPIPQAIAGQTLYLFVIVAGITAQSFISDRLVVGGDAARTAANILANKSLYRLGFTIFMLEMVAQLAVTAMFYDLLKPVNRSAARISAIIGFTAAGIKTFARAFYYLFIRGVDDEKWRARAAHSTTSIWR